MRVITGTAKGRKLYTLDGEDVRPTTDRVKESVFSIVQFQLQGKIFLDLFSGSGQMGIEALSRMSGAATFVDKNKKSIEVIKKNLELTNLQKNATIVNMDALNFISTTSEKYDIAFLDPPYKTGVLQKVLVGITSIMNNDSVIICENPVDEKLDDSIGNFFLEKNYVYGKICISVYRNKEVAI